MKTFTSRPTRRFRAEWLALATMLLVVGALFAWTLAQEHTNLGAQESARLQVQARVVNEDLIRQIDGANKALVGVRDELRKTAPAVDALANTAKLKLLTDAMAGISTMFILDAGGTIVASSRDDLLGKNFKERAYFDAPRVGADASMLYVSPPFKTVTNGNVVVVVSRVLTNGDGEFAGVICASLDPRYFNIVLGSVNYAPDMRASLIHGDGKLFLNMPNDPGLTAQLEATDLGKPGTLFARHRQSGQDTTLYSGPMRVGGPDRMLVLRSLLNTSLRMNQPLVVAVSRELAAVYAPWHEQLIRSTTLYLLLVLVFATSLYFDQRRRTAIGRIATAAAKERHQDAERIELALRGADLGLWDLHLPTDTLMVNQREREMIGYTAADTLPHKEWRKQVHPDDWPAINAAFAAHLRGETPAYACEHRMLHKAGHWVWISNRGMVVERDGAGTAVRVVGTHLDISERRCAAEALQQAATQLRGSEERLNLALEGSGLGLFDWDIATDLMYHSAQTAALHGEPAVETTRPPAQLRPFVNPDDLPAMLASIKNVLKGATPTYDAEFRLRKRSGGWLWVRARGRVVERAPDGRALRLAGTYADISERRRTDERLRHLAEFDNLTDLPNRALFRDRLQHAMQRAARSDSMALLFLDIDHFKTVNDTLGHEAGDQLLKVFARRMSEAVRQSDTVARLAGDEFTVILEGLREPEDARVVAAKLVETLAAPIALGDRILQVTASIGMALYIAGDTDDAAMLRRADAALYEAKRLGRNRYFCEMTDPADARRAHTPAAERSGNRLH